jgi:glycerol uptake facilitator-like aquaporin
VTGHADVVGYSVAQLVGGVLGVGLARSWGPHVADAAVRWAVIGPSRGMPRPAAAAIEAGATFVQLVLVFRALASARYRAWAPVVAGASLTTFIVVLAPITGAGFSPVRALAPDVMANTYPAVWIYLIGPLVGCAGAAGAVVARGRRPITGKLHHDPTISCHMRCGLPACRPRRRPISPITSALLRAEADHPRR